MTDTPGPLIAGGRSADVYDLGGGRVLRRVRSGPVSEHEVLAMRAARDGGVPVPEVYDVDGADMVLERVIGPVMIDELERRPWAVRRLGRELAALHVTLRAVPAPDGLRGDGPVLVHNDLHPGNVLLTADGPVVIDWEGATAGPADRDAAVMWLLAETADVDDLSWWLRPIVGLVRRQLVAAFMEMAGRPSVATVDAVCADRLADRNTRAGERARIAAFHERNGERPSAR